MSKFFKLSHQNKNATNGKNLPVVFLIAFLLSFTTTTRATEPVEKIFISADHMQMNIDTGKSIYTGNVTISQGDLVLTGDKVTLDSSNKELERLVIIGKPAHYNHVTKDGKSIKAQSEHMVYITNQNKLVMTTNAHLQQPNHKLSSQKIIYDTQKRTVVAGDKNKTSFNDGDSEKAQRVNITLTPKKPLTKESPP